MVLALPSVVLDRKVRGLCRNPYPGHPKGCPNFGNRPHCPPDAPLFQDVFDLGRPVFAVYNEFDLAAHVRRMKRRHPGWSPRQLRCVYYWQPGARAMLRQQVEAFLAEHDGYGYTGCPEGLGVHVTETLARAGLELEWPVKRIARQVALAAVPLEA
jgi:hypothetical protein